MKFKELDEKQIFTWWDRNDLRRGVKLGERQAFCFDLLELVDIHANKDVKELDNFDITLDYKVGRDGRGYLCSPMEGGKVLARRILLLTGEIMNEQWLKDQQPHTNGGIQNNLQQVDIMLEIFERKYKDLETAFKMLKMMIEDKLEPGKSDNNIMSTSSFIVGRSLTE